MQNIKNNFFIVIHAQLHAQLETMLLKEKKEKQGSELVNFLLFTGF